MFKKRSNAEETIAQRLVETLDLRKGGEETWMVTVGEGALSTADVIYVQCFGHKPAMIVADENTWAAAGEFLRARLGAAVVLATPLILPGAPSVHADMPTVERVQAALAEQDVVPIAVGAGTINDVVKLAAHRLGRPYIVVATAASMDGYTAFGASITEGGSKQTFDCPAPRALLADVEVIASAPAEMAASGYADLAAKISAGADWLLADALEIEPINVGAWELVQTPLRGWLDRPDGVRRGDHEAIGSLVDGLVKSGLAMQMTRNSRPASGAEHQFSHLWDMEGHLNNGRPVSHGFKVGIGTLAACGLYEGLLELPLDTLDVEARCEAWPSDAALEQKMAELHGGGPLRDKAMIEMRAKYITREQLRERLSRLREVWPKFLRQSLSEQLIPTTKLRDMLKQAGAPTYPEEIGITRARMRLSYYRAWTIRRRYTVLDLAAESGHFDRLVERAFSAGGVWEQGHA